MSNMKRKKLEIKDLFNHTRKGTNYKTDQNFYFLWMMLQDISTEELNNEEYRNSIRNSIVKMFSVIQNTPEDYSVEQFLDDISHLKNK